METIDNSQAVEYANEAAHERTVKECERLGITWDVVRGDHYDYSAEAQDIFNTYYNQEWAELEKRFNISLYQTPELTEQEQQVLEKFEEQRQKELYELCRGNEKEQTKEHDDPSLVL